MPIVGNDIVALVTGGVLEQQDISAINPVDPTFYNDMATLAEELINEFGRDITFIRFDQAESDSNKPWLGPTDPRTTPNATADIRGIFVSPTGMGLSTVDEDLLKRSDEICIVAPGVNSPPFDLATANEMIDNSVSKKVLFTETLKPGDVTLLYFLGVAR